MMNTIKYYWSSLKIKWYKYWLDDSAGLPYLIEDYAETIKDIAKKTLPLVKDSPKRKKILERIIKDSRYLSVMSEY